MVLHNFIVFEGIDGSGTSTQIARLKRRADSSRFFFTAEPTDTPVGRFLRTMLKGEVTLEPRTAAYLFAADRSEHVWGTGGIEERCAAGALTVSDRYFFSSLAYQSVDCGMELPAALNGFFPLPALVFFFDIEPEAALARVDRRGERELYEKADFLAKVRDAYKAVFARCAGSSMKLVTLDATESADAVETRIATELRKQYGV